MSGTLPITNLPEIYVYALGNQYVGATITRMINPDGANIGDRHQTQLLTTLDAG